MLTPGNRKLGASRLIWGFGLPSGATCPSLSAACQGPCYSARLEALRRRYERNLELSRRPDFARLVLAFLILNDVRVVRLHIGGDFYPAAYARKWLAAMRRAPDVAGMKYGTDSFFIQLTITPLIGEAPGA